MPTREHVPAIFARPEVGYVELAADRFWPSQPQGVGRAGEARLSGVPGGTSDRWPPGACHPDSPSSR